MTSSVMPFELNLDYVKTLQFHAKLDDENLISDKIKGVQAFQFWKHDFDLLVGGDGLDM